MSGTGKPPKAQTIRTADAPRVVYKTASSPRPSLGASKAKRPLAQAQRTAGESESVTLSPSIARQLPREQDGPRTGRKYEFQYEEAALACLDLLAEGDAFCVFCDWHDDFVVERDPPTAAYAFHQVKTRADTKGAWSIYEILGIKKPPAAKEAKAKRTKGISHTTRGNASSPNVATPRHKFEPRVGKPPIALRMLDHLRKFGDKCAMFALVSGTELADDPILGLLQEVRKANSVDALCEESKERFSALLTAYERMDPAITAAELWGLLGRIVFIPARASEADARVAVGLMGQAIWELSEVNISVKEQAQIASTLLKAVRDRSHDVLKPLPAEAEVRSRKAVSLDDVIKLLPLSFEGYLRLREQGKPALKNLSRLEDLCKRSGLGETMVTTLCDLKVEWHTWRAAVGDSLTPDLLGSLREGGTKLLNGLLTQRGEHPFSDLLQNAREEAARIRAVPRMPATLTETVMLGLVFALASESV